MLYINQAAGLLCVNCDDISDFILFQVKVFSAYYDPRPAAEGPTIRLLAIGWQAEYRYVGYLYCQLWYEHRAQPVVTLAKYDRIYPSVAWHEMWCSHFILCKLQDTIAIPYAVSIVPEPCRKPKNSLLILNRLSNTNKGQHALCLPLVYGKWDSPLPFIESLELHRILGVQKVTMYLKEDIPILNPVIHHYINTGFLEVVIWKIPNLPCSYFFQRAALNDCLYRNMNNFKFVAVNDVDEVLVPRMTDTWPELMSIIDRPDRGAFLFQHVYFRRNHTLKMDPQLISQTSYYRTIKVFPPGRIRCKTLYKAESSLKLDVHSSYQLLRGVHEYILSPEEGLLHHYRPQPFSSAHEKPEYNNFMEDRFMEKYKERLIKAVVDTHNKVMT